MLLASSALTAFFSLLLGIGLNMHNQALSGLSVVAFVISFSLGLAPMAWVILPEVMPKEGRTAGSSVAVSVNWITNFVAVRSFSVEADLSSCPGLELFTTPAMAETRR
jgi:SP family facilitated glucose transporter-like MFS transporter 3